MHRVLQLHNSTPPLAFGAHGCRELGAVSAEVVAELRYDLPATMKFHK